jgi:DNA-binding NarL/FixJ family response regulator
MAVQEPGPPRTGAGESSPFKLAVESRLLRKLAMTPYRIVLADDHVLVREGMRRLLEGVGDLEVIGEADDGLELLGLLRRLTPQLVVLDISMPRLRGIEAIPEVRAIRPQLKVLIVTVHRDRQYLIKAIAAGANGYVLKEEAATQLFAAIEKIRQGGIYVPPKLAEEMTQDWAQTLRGERSPVPEGHQPGWDSAPEGEELTVREREVLKLIGEGKSSREIAQLLCISHRTVENHRANLMAKLNVKKVADLVRYAISRGYL